MFCYDCVSIETTCKKATVQITLIIWALYIHVCLWACIPAIRWWNFKVVSKSFWNPSWKVRFDLFYIIHVDMFFPICKRKVKIVSTSHLLSHLMLQKYLNGKMYINCEADALGIHTGSFGPRFHPLEHFMIL